MGNIIKSRLDVVEREEHNDVPKVGEWYWLNIDDGLKGWMRELRRDDEHDAVLTCVVEVGSNYAKLKTPGSGQYGNISSTSWRIHFDDWSKETTFEPDPEGVIARRINQAQQRVRTITGDIQTTVARLGIGQQGALEESGAGAVSQALSTVQRPPEEVKAALERVRNDELPALFKKLEKANAYLGVWMTASALGVSSRLGNLRDLQERIDAHIFNVELYAGLAEEAVQLRTGTPAAMPEPLHLMQRRCYMDEEFFANLDVKSLPRREQDAEQFTNAGLESFESWLLQPENLDRLLPFPRTLVAFRIRNTDATYKAPEFKSVMQALGWVMWASEMDKADKLTFLYVRNGEQVFRVQTTMQFEHHLFPDEALAQSKDGRYVHRSDKKVITAGDYHARVAKYEEEVKLYEREHARWAEQMAAVAQKYRVGLVRSGTDDHRYWWNDWCYVNRTLLMLREAAWLDDALKAFPQQLREGTQWAEKNYFSGVSVGEHWTARGVFKSEVESLYKEAGEVANLYRAAVEVLHEPRAPKSEATGFEKMDDASVYFDEMQQLLKDEREKHNRLVLVLQGLLDRSKVLHPHPPWRLWTGDIQTALVLHYDSQRALSPTEKPPDFEEWRAQKNASLRVGSLVVGADVAWKKKHEEKTQKRGPKNDINPGPGRIARVVAVRKGRVTFRWLRVREFWGRQDKWRGWYVPPPKTSVQEFSCSSSEVVCVDDYQPGEFKPFYADPRSRADYFKWASLLFSAELHAHGLLSVSEPPTQKDKS